MLWSVSEVWNKGENQRQRAKKEYNFKYNTLPLPLPKLHHPPPPLIHTMMKYNVRTAWLDSTSKSSDRLKRATLDKWRSRSVVYGRAIKRVCKGYVKSIRKIKEVTVHQWWDHHPHSTGTGAPEQAKGPLCHHSKLPSTRKGGVHSTPFWRYLGKTIAYRLDQPCVFYVYKR